MAEDTIVKDVTDLDRANLGGESRSHIAHIMKIGELTFAMAIKKLQAAIEMFNKDQNVVKKLNEFGFEYGPCRDTRTILENEIKELKKGNNVKKEVKEMQKKCYRVIDLDLDVLTRLELLMENALRIDDPEFEALIARIKGFWKVEEKREEGKEGDPNQKLGDPQTRKRKRSETGGSVEGDIEGQVFACNEELEHVSGLVTKIGRFEESDRSENGDSEQESMDLAAETEEIDQEVDNQSGDLAIEMEEIDQKDDNQSGDPMDVEPPINIQQTEQPKVDEKGKSKKLEEEDEDEDEVTQKKSIESVLISEIDNIKADAHLLGLDMATLMSKRQTAETKFRKMISDQAAKESVEKVISDRVVELKGLESEFKSLKSRKCEHELEFADIVKNRITGVVDDEVRGRLNQLLKN